MDYSATNTALWGPIIQFGIIGGFVLIANILRRKVKFVRTSLIPTAVLAGFLLLILRSFNLLPVDVKFLEMITYHALALGFIALALRLPEKLSTQKTDGKTESSALHGAKSGALIVSTYLVQAIVGLVISLLLAYTFMPNLFKASGILLPMAYGQGPGQANNVGTTYEALGFAGGRSFGLTLAAAGYLVACVCGVIYLNVLHKKKKINRVVDKDDVSGSVTIDAFQHKNEIPISESIDKLSIQIAIILIVYLVTYLLIWGITNLLQLVAPGFATTVTTLLWGFNFIIASLVATATRGLMGKLRKVNIMKHQYQNNYLLNRLSGLAFDIMIVAGIASINVGDLSGYWIPFILMTVLGGVATFLYLKFICKKLCPNYFYESFFSMFGMLTGTLSSGVLLLRELDPEMKTPASNDLITGSSFGIVFGFPMLLLVSFAAQSDISAIISVGLIIVYWALLLWFMLRAGKGKKVLVNNVVKNNNINEKEKTLETKQEEIVTKEIDKSKSIKKEIKQNKELGTCTTKKSARKK